MNNKNNSLLNSLKKALKNFSPNKTSLEKEEFFVKAETIQLRREDLPIPSMVLLTFDCLDNFFYWKKPFEKIAWSIPILYKGVPFFLEHRKFGFFVSSYGNKKEILKIANEMISDLKKGIKVAERILKPKIENEIGKGNVVIENKYFYLTRFIHIFLDTMDVIYCFTMY